MGSKKLLFGVLASSLCAIGILLTIVLVPLSVKVVEPEDYGVVYDSLWRTFDKDILVQGRYLLKPTSEVFTFPNTFQPIDFSTDDQDIHCMSRDGMVIEVDVVSQFRYNKEQLVEMMYLYDRDLSTIINVMARSAFIHTCSQYFIESGFIQNRQNVSNHMLKMFQEQINISYVPVVSQYAELRNFHYPPDYREAIQNKQVAEQTLELLLNSRPVEIKNAETVMLKAQQQAEIDLQRANTEAEAIIQSASISAQAIETRWFQLAEGFNRTLSKLSMDADTFVEHYLSLSPLASDKSDRPIYVHL